MTPFPDQGMGIDEALFTLGLVSEPFYDQLVPGDPDDLAALHAWWGGPLPAPAERFFALAGGSLGPLRIVDWQVPWDLTLRTTRTWLEAHPDAAEALRRDRQVPIAHQGPSTELGHDDDVRLLLDADTGELHSEDSNRDAWEGLAALLLAWGHRALDPAMAVPQPRVRAWHGGGLPPARIAALHALAGARVPADGTCHVGRWLGVYRYPRSGLLLRLDGPEQLWVEPFTARRVRPERTAAHAVVQEGLARGWLRES